MTERIEMDKDRLLEVLWGICLADHLGDVMDSIDPLLEPFGLKTCGQDSLLDRMREMDLIPKEQRQ